MNFPTEIFGDVAVVHAPDEFSDEQAGAFTAFCGELDQSRVVLDIDAVESLDSAGLTALVDVQDRLRAEAGDLRIAVSNSVNRKILEITRLDQHLEVFDTVIDAVRSFRG
jgi:anti-sigma B factor antagonist